MIRATIVAVLLGGGLAPLASADVVILRSGGRLEGRVAPPEEPDRRYYLVEVEGGARLAIPTGEVRRLERSDDLDAYRQRAERIADDAESHWELARWCKQNSLLDLWRLHVERVIQLDREDATAQAALGRMRYEGQWLPREQVQRMRGMVRYSGKWRVPEDVALIERAEEADVAAKQWGRKIRRLRSTAAKGRDGGDALAELQAIDDPAAAVAVAELLGDSSEPVQLRRVYVQLLGQWRVAAAVEGLIKAGLNDPDADIRERALDYLERGAKKRAVAAYTGMLDAKENRTVQRAGEALASLRDPSAIEPLIEALVTVHKSVVGGGAGMNLSFDGSGGGGLSTGGKPRVVSRKIKNPPVLTALLALEPGVNYQYDKDRWRAWYADRTASYPYDLRRDP